METEHASDEKVQPRKKPTPAELGFDTSEGLVWIFAIPVVFAVIAGVLLFVG